MVSSIKIIIITSTTFVFVVVGVVVNVAFGMLAMILAKDGKVAFECLVVSFAFLFGPLLFSLS